MWSTRRHRLRALQALALGLASEGRVEEALATVAEAGDLVRSAGRRAPRGADADVIHLRACVLHDAGRLEDSEAAAREAVAVRRGLGALDDDQTSRLSDSLELLANVLTKERRLEEAEALSAEVVALRARMPWPEQARALLNRSATLLESGREEEGLAVALELVRGAVAGPGQSGMSDPSFVQGLSNLGVLLRRNGRWSEALAVQDLAVTELRTLAQLGGPESVADLATALSNQAMMQIDCGRPEEAVAPGGEALALRAELAAASMAAFGPELSVSLNNHAVLLHKLERHEEAEPVARRCVDLRRGLHAVDPGAYERKLANALATHAEMLTRCGRAQEAVVVGREAVERLVALEAAEPGQHTMWLASALDSLAAALAGAGREDEAFATSRDAVARAAEGHAAHGAGVGDALAEVLLAGAERHAARHHQQALAWADGAVALLLALSAGQPEAHAVALTHARDVRARLGA